MKKYADYPPPAEVMGDPMTYEAAPDADSMKSPMYKAQPGLPYSRGTATNVGLGQGIPGSKDASRSTRAPHYPMKPGS